MDGAVEVAREGSAGGNSSIGIGDDAGIKPLGQTSHLLPKEAAAVLIATLVATKEVSGSEQSISVRHFRTDTVQRVFSETRTTTIELSPLISCKENFHRVSSERFGKVVNTACCEQSPFPPSYCVSSSPGFSGSRVAITFSMNPSNLSHSIASNPFCLLTTCFACSFRAMPLVRGRLFWRWGSSYTTLLDHL